MSRKNVSLVLPAFIILLFASVALAAIPVTVTVGKGTVITLKEPSKRLSLADPSIADLNLISPTQIVLNGKKVGVTNLIVWNNKGKPTFFDITVVGGVAGLERQIQEMAPGVTVERMGTAVVLHGQLDNEKVRKKIESLAKTYSERVVDLTVIKEAQQVILQVRVAQIDRTKMKEFGLSYLIQGGTADVMGSGLTSASPTGELGGVTATQEASLITDYTTNPPTINQVNTVTKNFTRATGFNLDNNPAPQFGMFYFPSGAAVYLRALESKGLAKILAEPNLVVRSGEKGNFLVGSKIPVQVVTGVGANQTPSIQFEQVGVVLNFAPEVLDNGEIRLKIDPAEVSNVQQFLSFSGILAPVIDTRQVSTSVDLRDGESLILAGLLSETNIKNLQKIPILGDIPILGALFRSTKDDLEKKELAFFITPKLVKPLAPGVKPELPGEKPLTPAEESEYNWIPLPAPSGK